MPILEHPECSIRPGCLYNIIVESTDRAINKTVQLLVPGKRVFKLHQMSLRFVLTSFNRYM